jgi:ubiquinol-cytochrome c reductase cytochrome b subunit
LCYPINKILFWRFIIITTILTWIGGRPVEDPFVIIGQLITLLYFLYFLLTPVISFLWDKKRQ